jgi:hypothetical protein
MAETNALSDIEAARYPTLAGYVGIAAFLLGETHNDLNVAARDPRILSPSLRRMWREAYADDPNQMRTVAWDAMRVRIAEDDDTRTDGNTAPLWYGPATDPLPSIAARLERISDAEASYAIKIINAALRIVGDTERVTIERDALGLRVTAFRGRMLGSVVETFELIGPIALAAWRASLTPSNPALRAEGEDMSGYRPTGTTTAGF